MFSRVHIIAFVLAAGLIALGLCWRPESAGESIPSAEVVVPVKPETAAEAGDPGGMAKTETKVRAQEGTRILVSEALQDAAWVPDDIQEKMIIGDRVVTPQVQQGMGLGSTRHE